MHSQGVRWVETLPSEKRREYKASYSEIYIRAMGVLLQGFGSLAYNAVPWTQVGQVRAISQDSHCAHANTDHARNCDILKRFSWVRVAFCFKASARACAPLSPMLLSGHR